MADGADALYALPLDEFTAARNALARGLARAGDKDAATEVRKLIKPSKAAWALNQLARRQPDDVERLLAAGASLREAQQRALEGDAGSLREASRAQRDEVERLAAAAAELLGGEGGQADRLRATLQAAATDPAAGELLRRGRLVAELDPSGFGIEGLESGSGGAAAVRVRKPTRGRDRGKGGGAEEDAAAREREQARREARREAERLRTEAERARAGARRLLARAEEAEARAREARAEADAAGTIAEEAERLAVEAAGKLDPEAG